MATFEIYEDTSGDYRWRLTGGNDIIADSGEGYRSRQNAQEAVDRIQADGPTADTLEFGRPHFELYKDRSGEFRWRFIASNGRIVADSGEGYSSKGNAKRAIENVQSDVGSAGVTTEDQQASD